MSENESSPKVRQPWSFEMFLRKFFKGIIDPVAAFFLRIGLKPDHITILGFLLSSLSAYFIATGKITIGGLILLIGGPLDVVDGSMARKLGEPSKLGALFDSVVDRYSEFIVFIGLLIYFLQKPYIMGCILVIVALGGSLLVSYVKARAESLGFNAKVGILTRVERLMIMIIGLIFNIPLVALWIIAILSNITAIQRFLFVRKQALLINK